MHSLFPELERVDQNTLFVIGNGFDLASGIKSSYYNFKQWLILNKRHQLINLMDIFFSNKRDVWGDIEKALGEYDEDSILEFCKPNEEFDYDHPTRSIAAIEDSPDWIFRPVLDEFIEAFTDWVDSIDITVGDKIRDLPSCSKFLTFNYTETLEKIYGIYNPQIQISAESETKRSIFREKDKTKRSKKESAQHSKSRNKSFVMTSVSAL